MKRYFTYILVVSLALFVSCNKEDQARVEELNATLTELEGKVDEMGLPSAVKPGVETDDEYFISFDRQKYGVDAGGSVTVKYYVQEPSTVSVTVNGDLTAKVNATSETSGEIVISAPDPASPAEIVINAETNSGMKSARKVPVMIRDPYTDATRTYVNALGYYNFKPQWATLDNFKKLAEAGLKSVTVETGDYDYKIQMDLAHQAGLKTLPIIGWVASNYERDPANYKGLDQMIDYLMHHPATMAYHICDEPSTRDIPSLRVRKEKIESLDPDHPVYINLNPDGSINALGVDNYHDYIEAFARDCKCEFISFDMYPILPGGAVMTHWHRCLRDVSEVTREYGIPFWAFAASCWIDRESATQYRGRPSTENLRLQVYTDLAYGAQVVQYFTIQQYGGTSLSPILADGTWTEAYDYLKEATLQVQKRGYVFDGCNVHKVGFAGISSVWGDLLAPSDLPAEIESLNTSDMALVSLLGNRGNEYVAIVNQSYTDKIKASVTLSEAVYTIERDGSFVERPSGYNEFTIDEGDLLLFKIK